MHHVFALAASLLSLGLICAIYYCNLLSRPGSLARSDMLAMILLALLTGLYPTALVAALAALWQTLSGGVALSTLLGVTVELGSLAAIAAGFLVLRALVRETYRRRQAPEDHRPVPLRKAA